MLDESSLARRAQASVGTTIAGKYRIDGVLGIGGMAVVYAATACPATGYTVKSLQYAGFTDGRDCSCDCMPTATCNPQVLYAQNSCGSVCPGAFLSTGCNSFNGGCANRPSSGGFWLDSLNISLTPHPVASGIGSVTVASPVTICCTN